MYPKFNYTPPPPLLLLLPSVMGSPLGNRIPKTQEFPLLCSPSRATATLPAAPIPTRTPCMRQVGRNLAEENRISSKSKSKIKHKEISSAMHVNFREGILFMSLHIQHNSENKYKENKRLLQNYIKDTAFEFVFYIKIEY